MAAAPRTLLPGISFVTRSAASATCLFLHRIRAGAVAPGRRWWCSSWLVLLACLGLALALMPAPAHAQTAATSTGCAPTTPIPQARRVVAIDGRQVADETVALPDHLPLAWRNEHVRITYTLDVAACAQGDSPALWVFRAGAPYQVLVDGQPQGSLMEHRDQGAWAPLAEQTPALLYNGRIAALFPLPMHATQVQVVLVAMPFMPSGLVLAHAGPTNQLLPLAMGGIEAVVGLTDAAAGLMLVLALLAMVLWMQRPHDLGFLWMTLASVSWSLRALAYFGSPIRIPPMWFEQFNPLNVMLTALAMCAATLSTIVVRKQDFARGGLPDWRRTPRRVMVFMLVSGCLAFVLAQALGSGAWLARGYAQLCALLLSLWTLWWVWSGQLRMGRWHRAGLIGGYLLLIGSAVHDMGLVTGHIPPTGPSYLFWGFVVLLVIYAVISGDYIISTLNRAENTNQELEQRVAQKSEALEHSYAQLRHSELAAVQATARQQERERLLRDMHDGLGAQLMTALRGVERGALGPEQITQSLQDGLEELRMLMDSADMGGNLSAALAAWRHRWDARMGAVGVQLHWHLDDGLEGVGVTSDQLLQVMRVLQEAATNVVKHAHARNMDVRAEILQAPGPRVLAITLQDDGVGLPSPDHLPGRRGLQNMRHRAEVIGATLQIVNRAAPVRGCAIVLRVPLPGLDAPSPAGAGQVEEAGGAAQLTSPRRAASTAASARDEMPSLR